MENLFPYNFYHTNKDNWTHLVLKKVVQSQWKTNYKYLFYKIHLCFASFDTAHMKMHHLKLCASADTSHNIKHLFCFVWIMLNGCNLRYVKWNWSLLLFIYCCELKLIMWFLVSLHWHQCPAVHQMSLGEWFLFFFLLRHPFDLHLSHTNNGASVDGCSTDGNITPCRLVNALCQAVTHTHTHTHTHTYTPEVFCFWGLCLFVIWFFALSYKITSYLLTCTFAMLPCYVAPFMTTAPFNSLTFLSQKILYWQVRHGPDWIDLRLCGDIKSTLQIL